MSWWKKLKGRVKLNEPLKNHTTFKIGGPAKWFIEPRDIADLKLLLILLKENKIKYYVIGAGSNLLVSDKGLNAAVIKLSSPYFRLMRFKGNYLEAGPGVPLAKAVSSCLRRNLTGMEFLSGIPGTVGGALTMNAGQDKSGLNIGRLAENVTVLDRGLRVRQLDKNNIKFGYRSSSLAKFIILSARFKLAKEDREKIRQRLSRYIRYRRATQDYSGASAGCVFKNPPSCSAGKLIDLCGLKGKKVKGASLSRKHANFIINESGAKAEDVRELINLVRKEVKDKFKINLKPEVKIWGR